MDKDFSKKELSKFAKIVLIVYFVAFTFIVMPSVYTITAHVTGLVIGLLAELTIHKFVCKNKAA